MSKLEQIQALRAARVARNSRGGVEGNAASPQRTDSGTRRPGRILAPLLGTQTPPGTGRAGVESGPRETKPKRKAKKAKRPRAIAAPKVKIGRPRVEDRGKTLSDRKPWLSAKPPMSRATWYRRQVKS